jgi:tol-pal system protein YbgF
VVPGLAPGIAVFAAGKRISTAAPGFSHNFDAARSMLAVLTAGGVFIMTRSRPSIRGAAFATLALLLLATPAGAQDQRSSPGFLDNLFSRGEPPAAQRQGEPAAVNQPRLAQSDNPADVNMRVDRIENALRQLTGTIEQLQYQNQQLQMQLKRMQDDTEYRFQQLGSKGGLPPAGQPRPMSSPAPLAAPAAAAPGKRSDVFDPTQHPGAPGAPRVLGNQTMVAPPPSTNNAPPAASNAPPIGVPGGREAGAPLDLTTLAGNPPPPAQAAPMATAAPMSPTQLPPPPAHNTSATGAQLATLPPSKRPQDEYDMAYGYVLHKDYGLAAQAFRDFIGKYPNEHLLPDAQYWLGEALFQQQHYRDAGEAFLAVTTKYEHSGKAPDAMLRLGQSLAALHKKDAACVTFAQVGIKYPRASASVKHRVAQEQKRTHC